MKSGMLDLLGHAQLLAKADYVLADFDTKTAYISNPGCYAIMTLLSLAPLYKESLIQYDSVIVDAKSGLSGAGKKGRISSHYVNANEKC